MGLIRERILKLAKPQATTFCALFPRNSEYSNNNTVKITTGKWQMLRVQEDPLGPPPPPTTMASAELAQKLQRRLLRDGSCSDKEATPEKEESEEGVTLGDAAAAAGSQTNPGDTDEDRSVLSAAADPELSAKLSRRQDINAGAARPRFAQIFNPYTEFKEFTRRQIKDMERLFRL
ncbi:UNVERIFIED_CONTAM: hypothetical protein K2H54_051377 [Gekko kuhli]